MTSAWGSQLRLLDVKLSFLVMDLVLSELSFFLPSVVRCLTVVAEEVGKYLFSLLVCDVPENKITIYLVNELYSATDRAFDLVVVLL